MNIYINGQTYPLPHKNSLSITETLSLHFKEVQQSTFAVALNGDFIGRIDYHHTLVKNGDSIDILQPIQGG